MRKIRLLLADDHAGLVAAVRSLLESEVDIVAAVDNGQSLFEAARNLKPDIIVTDISMPKLNGIEATDRLRDSGCSSKVVFLTVHSDPDVIRVALQAGALGYVFKTLLAEDLLFAIQEVSQGRTFVSSTTRADQKS